MLSQGLVLVGNHPKFNIALETARNVAVTKTPVLISGEAGSGKKALGAYIHNNSVRKNARIEIVDCTNDSQMVEKMVLGFRDDQSGKFNRGVLELANGGTVIFANIDALDENFQNTTLYYPPRATGLRVRRSHSCYNFKKSFEACRCRKVLSRPLYLLQRSADRYDRSS
jgi:transcriptional regulator of aromatic amino acid metabolism